MKMLVLGWMRMAGVGRDSKKPYDFARLNVANEVTDHASAEMKREGGGFEQGYIDLRIGCEGQFRGVKFPAVLDLDIDHQMGRTGKLEPICVGLVAPLKAAG